MTAAQQGPSYTTISAGEIRTARFSSRRHGWDEDEVRLFLDRLANDIQNADSERAAMRAELHGLRGEVERLRREHSGEGGQTRLEVSVHAVGLLSQAQQTADSCVAEAEQYARDLITAARNQYQDILQNAQQAAANSMREISTVVAGHEDAAVSVPEIEYVRTFARVAQVQLRSVLDALTQEVDKLGQLPRLDEPPAPRDVSWQPSNLVALNVTRSDAS